MNRINWSQVDAVPEKDYNYAEAPEVDKKFFKNATLLIPDEIKKVYEDNPDLPLQFIKQSLKGLEDIQSNNVSEFRFDA